MLTWDTTSGALQSTIEFEKGFTATSILHPATYLNKVLIASNEGNMELWNIQTHHLQSTLSVLALHLAKSRYTTFAWNERLMRMQMEGGWIRALGFRGAHPRLRLLRGPPRTLGPQRAHDGAISALEWVPGQPLLITSGEDNSVKQWVLDSPTAAPRLLKFRSGHHSPPHLIRYYGDDGKQLLTASRDRSLRCTSVVRDSRSFELSQGSLAKKATSLSLPVASLKFPPITSLSYQRLGRHPHRARRRDLRAYLDHALA
ncbi:hypothetical protein D9611_012521 [Ephemerocybe angulata]|uniref:Uncharacterized protein n=1 Tax=Ephemerocybe angulata TaxID=980116 RepID=A0A8H5CAQ7_9AGAR|nr:hypothetical protein D9611_012521 [Tulosesus angulatus]